MKSVRLLVTVSLSDGNQAVIDTQAFHWSKATREVTLRSVMDQFNQEYAPQYGVRAEKVINVEEYSD